MTRMPIAAHLTGPWRAVPILGFTQIVGWGSTFYAIGVLKGFIAAETGWSPVMVVADSSIVANQASGVVFVVRADHTTKQSVRAAAEQLDAANAHLIGSVLNGADVLRNPYYYSAYYRKDYARYYVSSSASSSKAASGR